MAQAMTAQEALQQMRHYAMWESRKQPDHINEMLDQWADAIEADLAAKDAHLADLQNTLEWHRSQAITAEEMLKTKDARIAELEREVAEYATDRRQDRP